MGKILKLKQQSLSQLPLAAEQILRFANESARSKIFAFYGQMGAGKTTLIKEMCKQLGSRDNFSSPTYGLVNEYAIEGTNQKIYHMDLFRLKSLEEALDLGVMDYLNGEDYCLMEWPELIEDILPVGTVKVAIETEDNMREMIIFIK
jgi:tRNA threonylcarbamoyladenosine biosynthesis protein TsaE